MKNLRVFVVDDELAIQRLLRYALESYGYQMQTFSNSEGLLEAIAVQMPSIILLDVSLGVAPDGIAICQQIREQHKVPIIMLTVQDDKWSKLAALNAGADDYLTKPFDVEELEARIRAVLRRSAYEIAASSTGIIQINELQIDLLKRRVFLDEAEVHLTNKEYDFLKLLASQRGKVVTFETILKALWGQVQSKEANHKISVHVNALRKKLNDNPSHPRFIFSELGVGYRFVDLAE